MLKNTKNALLSIFRRWRLPKCGSVPIHGLKPSPPHPTSYMGYYSPIPGWSGGTKVH